MAVQPLTDQTTGTLTLGDRPVRRLGFGAMHVTGQGIWGPPDDPQAAKRLLRLVIELGVNLIDTADSYGPGISEELIAEALYPYPQDLLIATKGGLERGGPGRWSLNGRPEHLRRACEGSLKRLRLEVIDLYQLHAPDPGLPYQESVGTLVDLRAEGKIRAIGLSNVTVDQLRVAQRLTRVASVQNRYNLVDRGSQDVLDACTAEGIGFIPYFPLASGDLDEASPLSDIAARLDATAAQVALAWLLRRSPVMLPIPGTSSSAHLEENVSAAWMVLDDEDMETLQRAA